MTTSLLAGMVLAVGRTAGSAPASAAQSYGWLTGRVTIGPMCDGMVARSSPAEPPVEPCEGEAERAAQARAARAVIVYDQATRSIVARARVARSGTFRVRVPAGTYVINLSGPGGEIGPMREPSLRELDVDRVGNARPQTVNVVAGKTVTVDFNVDTGIR